jgi:hypothetical protein
LQVEIQDLVNPLHRHSYQSQQTQKINTFQGFHKQECSITAYSLRHGSLEISGANYARALRDNKHTVRKNAFTKMRIRSGRRKIRRQYSNIYNSTLK